MAQSKSKPSDSDKSQIIKSILSKVFPQKDEETICLSTENIPKSLLEQFPEISGVEIKLAAPDKLEEEAGCTIEHYSFGNFERKGSAVLVYFIKSSVSGKKYAGRGYSYHKVKGKWRGKILGAVIGAS